MTARRFGTNPNGHEVREVTIGDGVLVAAILDYGATLRDIRFEGRPMILGLETIDDYLAHSPYFGAVCGRCANRIAGGRFEIDGIAHDVGRNEAGRTHLHGGAGGFHLRSWTIEESGPNHVRFAYVSPDGEEGYPGTVTTRATYRVAGSTLTLEVEATTDRPTLVNIAGHAYFDLDGSGSILDHELTVFADRYTPADATLIPTGVVKDVAGSPFDFRHPRPVRLMVDGARVGYDVNYCLDAAPVAAPRRAARVVGPQTGTVLEVWTTEPGIQFYDGAGVNVPVAGLDGRRYGANAGFCLEPQRWPDAIHHPNFPSAVLRPGEVYRQVTEYRFSYL